MDPTTGVMLNPDMEMYKLAGAGRHPRDRRHGATTPPTRRPAASSASASRRRSATAAAIGNAVTNAIGVRVADWPMTPRERPERPGHSLQEGKA